MCRSNDRPPGGTARWCARRASAAVSSRAEAKLLEATLKFEMGAAPSDKGTRTVAEVVASYIADGAVRLSPGSIDFYRMGAAALPTTFTARPVGDVTPLVLDGLYAEMRLRPGSWCRTVRLPLAWLVRFGVLLVRLVRRCCW